jgi:hypothetical protein
LHTDPILPSEYVARLEFDIEPVKDHLRIPFDSNDNVTTNLIEPKARAFPDFGSGGATQLKLDGSEVTVSIHMF